MASRKVSPTRVIGSNHMKRENASLLTENRKKKCLNFWLLVVESEVGNQKFCSLGLMSIGS